MTEKTIYIADDGKEFDNKADCVYYESKSYQLNNFNRVIEAANIIKDYCTKMRCNDCPLYSINCHDGSDYPIYMNIPMDWEPDKWDVEKLK